MSKKPSPTPLELAYVEAAMAMQRDGEIEVDENAEVSLGDDAGAYVQAWLWVPQSALPEEFQNSEEDEDEEDERA